MKNTKKQKWVIKDIFLLPIVLGGFVLEFLISSIEYLLKKIAKQYFWITYVIPVLYIFHSYGTIKGFVSIPLLYVFNFVIGVQALVCVLRTTKIFPKDKIKKTILIQSLFILLSLIIYDLLDFNLIIIMSSIIGGLLHGLLVPYSNLCQQRLDIDSYRQNKGI